jgi:hypothetical protein
MSEHHLPRNPPSTQEAFVAYETSTGKSFPIRECTDEQLEKHLQEARKQAAEIMQEALRLIGVSGNASKAAAIIAYEIDRRARTLSVVSDLSQVQGLRRQ